MRVESLARSRAEIVAATDAERRRIERDLHDGAQQRLVSLAMNLGMARASLTDAPEPVRQVIEQAHDEATEALAELREFVRGLHPAVLDDRGLDAALSGIAANAPLPVRLRVDVATRCSPRRRGRRLLRRVRGPHQRRQARRRRPAPRSPSTRTGDRLRIVVTRRRPRRRHPARRPATLPTAAAPACAASPQRAAAVDGTLTIDSPPGGPTTITVELPCES